MSIPNSRPKRDSRRTISAWKNFVLLAVLSVAIALQLSYPLIEGERLRLVTIATVYWAAGAMLLHALFAYGLTYALRFLFITFTYALIIEQVGMRTTWPFGSYEYSPSLGYQIFDVPLVVPFAWIMMAHSVFIAARRVAPNFVFLVGGYGLMAWDLFLDPQMVSAGRWSWEVSGRSVPFQPEIPLSNTFGWLLTGMGLMALLDIFLPKKRRSFGSSRAVPEFFLAWSWIGGIAINTFHFDRPGVALIGGTALGALVIWYSLSVKYGRRD
ncbi:MAG: carotenoid biosynthesis protein [Actinobacteria bacterium]|nr:carotenoid biosynthesis protein [Actinomycetota bacterium]